ncbi:hypothetical protein E0T84_26030 [Mycobacterium sp. DBP42]|nr:hypothetical protein E0T84_26030 [Mycobacterium sp. DBP42]
MRSRPGWPARRSRSSPTRSTWWPSPATCSTTPAVRPPPSASPSGGRRPRGAAPPSGCGCSPVRI